jgi:hypothetical protein
LHFSRFPLAPAKKKGKKMNAEIKNGTLIITIQMQQPTPSATGKTMVVASSKGNKATSAMVDGKPVIIGLNAYIQR